MDVIVLSEGSEEETVARALVQRRLVADMKPLVVSERTEAEAEAKMPILRKRRVLNVSPHQWWDRKLELGPDDHLMLLVQWAASMERWQREQRELQWRVFELEEVVRMKRKVKGKGKEKEDAEEDCKKSKICKIYEK